MTTDNNGDASPFPTAADMDLDLWHAGPTVHPTRFHRTIDAVANAEIVYVLGGALHDSERDAIARRIEMLGDMYDELRKLADKARAAGIDTTQADIMLTDFVAPKPFTRQEDGE